MSLCWAMSNDLFLTILQSVDDNHRPNLSVVASTSVYAVGTYEHMWLSSKYDCRQRRQRLHVSLHDGILFLAFASLTCDTYFGLVVTLGRNLCLHASYAIYLMSLHST